MENKLTPESQTLNDLPMVVFLKGDEEFSPEFSIDAEGAMSMLGIKRSRLTQISGKELRVGRIRVDRYIRPMYRQKDLEDYQSWTRATASHQSSSQALQNIGRELVNNWQDLAVVHYREHSQRILKLQSTLQQTLNLSLRQISDGVHKEMARQNLEGQQDRQLLNKLLNIMQQLRESVGILMKELKNEWGTSRELYESLNREWRESQQLIALFRKDLSSLSRLTADHLSHSAEVMKENSERLQFLERELNKWQHNQEAQKKLEPKRKERPEFAKIRLSRHGRRKNPRKL